MIILGIDPGLQHTGWGAIASEGNRLRFLTSGTIHTTRTAPLAERLLELHVGVQKVLETLQPDTAAMEETFVNVNGATTLKLGQARGALLLTLAIAAMPIHEYAPRLIKKTIVGSGAADKNQIQHMVKMLLPTAQFDSPDAADALAIALCHAQHSTLKRVLEKS